MSSQSLFTRFHKVIKVETDELRDKRDILMDKIRTSLKKSGHPLAELINQGSYIYGVGVTPVGDVEYDIDVGLEFPIKSSDYEAKTVRKWVYDAVADHTDNVEDRGPCIRVRYAAGYHVDLVVYSRYKDNENVENFQLARKDNTWNAADPKGLKDQIAVARKPFSNSKDSSGSDQLQRITRYLKRWNDFEHPEDSPDKPFGLATLLLVIKHLKSPTFDSSGDADDLSALINVCRGVDSKYGRIIVSKPTPAYEDVFSKLSDEAMADLKVRFGLLLKDLEAVRGSSDEVISKKMRKQFGDDFPESLTKSENDAAELKRKNDLVDMTAAIPSFKNPSKPWFKI